MKELYSKQEQKVIYNLIKNINYEESIYKSEINDVFKSLLFFTHLHYEIAFKDYINYFAQKVKMMLPSLVNYDYNLVRKYYVNIFNDLLEDTNDELDLFEDLNIGLNIGMKKRKYAYLEFLYILLHDLVDFQNNRIEYYNLITDCYDEFVETGVNTIDNISNKNTEHSKKQLILKRQMLSNQIKVTDPYPKDKIIY